LGALAFDGAFEGLGRTLGLGAGGRERFGALGGGGPAFDVCGALLRGRTLAAC